MGKTMYRNRNSGSSVSSGKCLSENAGSNKYYFTTKQRKFKGQGFGRNFAKKIAPLDFFFISFKIENL